MKSLFLCLLLLSGAACAWGEELFLQNGWTFNLYFENDLFSESDQDYTNGVKLSWVSPDLQSYVDDPRLPGWVRRANKRLTFFHKNADGLQRNLVISLGQSIYTPKDLNRTDVIKDDRPYAGWLYMGFGFHSKTEDQLDSVELNVGVVGPASFAHEAQDFVHELRGFEKFKGWDNQLSNEPGIAAVYEHKDKFMSMGSRGGFGADAITHFGGSLGNVATYLNLGFETRLGWNIPGDFGTSAIRPAGDNSAPGSRWDPRLSGKSAWGLHAFVSVDGRAVLHDIFLDGNTYKDSHSVDREPLVADAAAGVSLIYRRVKLSYAQIFRTREFRGQKHGHSYGSLSMSWVY
ncbi:MAG: lipid A deacylase LpxR family protein [bacterium]